MVTFQMGPLIRNCFVICFVYSYLDVESFAPFIQNQRLTTIQHHRQQGKDHGHMGIILCRSNCIPSVKYSFSKLQDANLNDELYDDDEISEETWRMIEEGQPSEWEIMKDVSVDLHCIRFFFS